MAFITVNNNVVSYAEATDVKDKDQRVFESNEINYSDAPEGPVSLDEYVEDLTTKSTARINQKIRASARWREYLGYSGVGYDDLNNIPDINPTLIIGRRADFTDMCCYYTLKEYLLPKVADFGNPESPEVQKIKYYENKFTDLFDELMGMMDWYDRDASGTVDTSEKMVRFVTTRRSRSRKPIVRVR